MRAAVLVVAALVAHLLFGLGQQLPSSSSALLEPPNEMTDNKDKLFPLERDPDRNDLYALNESNREASQSVARNELNETIMNDESVDNDTSDSMLKPSRQQQTGGPQSSTAQPSSTRSSKSSMKNSASSSDNHHQDKSQTAKRDPKQNSNEAKVEFQTKSSKGKLKFFTSNQQKRLSLISLLPKSKRLGEQTTTQAPTSPAANNQTRSRMSSFALSALTEAAFDPFLATAGSHHHQESFMFAPQMPYPSYPGNHNFMRFAQQQHQQAATNFVNRPNQQYQQQPQAQMAQQQSQPQTQQQPLPQQQQQQMMQQTAPQQPFDQITAAQSIAHQHRVQMGDQLPIFFATTGQKSHVDKTGAGITLVPAPVIAHQQLGNQVQHQQQSAAAAAAALIGERAKSFIGHLSGGSPNSNQEAHSNHLMSNLLGHRNIGHAMKVSATNSGGPNNGGFGNMKNPADEAWTATNVAGAGATPTIIVEHDGPSVTTVDFNNRFRGRLLANSDPDDDDSNSFYSEGDEESLGSHEAGRVAKLKQQQAHRMTRPRQPAGLFESQIQSPGADALLYYNSNNNNQGQHNLIGGGPLVRHGAQGNGILHLASPGDLVDDAVRDYMRFERVLDQDQRNYPNSINAIKEQNTGDNESNDNDNNGDNNKPSFASALRTKLANSSDGQIEQLIRELQDLNESKRKQNNNSSGDSGRRNKDEYDDYDEDDDDETRVLRRKLMSRLRHKNHQKRGLSNSGASLSASSSSIMQNPAVKIPLHALLMAALDRRMSPSEQNSWTSVADEATATTSDKGTIQQHQDGQTDFDDTTALLGQEDLLDPVKLQEALQHQHDHQQQQQAANLSPLSVILANEQYEFNKTHSSADRDLMNIVSGPLNGDKILTGSEAGSLESQTPTAATPTPVVVSKQQHQSERSYGRPTRQDSIVTSVRKAYGGDSGGERGENEGDFDVDRQVEEFARDKDESAQLEPPWMRTQKRIGGDSNRRHHSGGTSQGAEDDYGPAPDSDYESWAGSLRQRKRAPSSGEERHETHENKFFNRLQRDTHDDDDIDKSTSGIDNPIGGSEEDRGVQAARSLAGQRKHEDGEDLGGLSEGDSDYQEDSRQQMVKEDEEDSKQVAGIRQGSESSARPTTSSSTWRPQMVDDEVRKIEKIAREREAEQSDQEQRGRNRRHQKDKAAREYSPENDDELESEPPPQQAQRYEEFSESRTHETTLHPANHQSHHKEDPARATATVITVNPSGVVLGGDAGKLSSRAGPTGSGEPRNSLTISV